MHHTFTASEEHTEEEVEHDKRPVNAIGDGQRGVVNVSNL